MNNLNGVDVLGLHYLNGQPEGEELSQQFWKYKYSVSSGKIIQKLIDSNVIELKQNPQKSLKNLTVVQLKELLRNNELKLSGNKPDLIQRIIKEVPEDELILNLEKVWTPTEEGQQLINNTDFIIFTHNKLSYITSVYDVYQTFLETPNASSKDILIKELENKIKFRGSLEDHINISHALLDISQVCREYEDFDGQFDYLVRALVNKFSHNQNGYAPDHIMKNFNFFFSHYQIQLMFIRDLKNLIYTNDKYIEKLPNKINKYFNSQLIKHFTPEEVHQIITAYVNEDEDEITRLYQKIFKKNGGTDFSDNYTYRHTIEIDLNDEKPEKSQNTIINNSKNKTGCGCLLPFILLSLIFPLLITIL